MNSTQAVSTFIMPPSCSFVAGKDPTVFSHAEADSSRPATTTFLLLDTDDVMSYEHLFGFLTPHQASEK